MSRKLLQLIARTIQVGLFLVMVPVFLLLWPYRIIRRVVKKKRGFKPNIIWAPIPIISISHNRDADRLMGYRSDSLVYSVFHITKASMFDFDLTSFMKNPLVFLMVPFLVMIWVAVRYDILHIFYRGGFLYLHPILSRAELVVWRLLGVRTIAMAYGSDVRQESITRGLGKYHAYLDMSHEQVLSEAGATEEQIRARVNFVIRWASKAFSMGDMIEYTPGSTNDLFYWAIDIHDWRPVYNAGNQKVVVVHAPNSPHYKGTRFLLEVIERLKSEGYDLELVLVRGMTNDEARRHYERADIFAEQFIIGFHGLTAIEAMALGKPVLCYIRKPELYVPAPKECPIVNTTPDNLYENLKSLLDDAARRQAIGRAGREYVEKYWSLESVGKRLDQVYRSIW